MVSRRKGVGGVGRKARVFGNVAERAEQSYPMLSLMITDSSITKRGEGPWLAGSLRTVDKIT